MLTQDAYAGKKPLFLGIDHVRFLKKILPGSTITVQAELLKERREKAIATCTAKVFCEGAEAASGEVTLAMR